MPAFEYFGAVCPIAQLVESPLRYLPPVLNILFSGLILAAGGALLAVDAGTAEPGAPFAAAPALITPTEIADPRIAPDTLLDDDGVTWSNNGKAERAKPAAPNLTALDPELECVAKVVHHEAGNQSRIGQLAVAQIMVNRARTGGHFPTTLCDVANQPGQFFNVTNYNPRRDTRQWRSAIDVASEALSGQAGDVTQGAYFYHSADQAPNRFFQSRKRVLTLGDHIFYR